MNHLRGFSDIHKEDAALAGGKGASLGEMKNAGIPVPPGFVILAQAFDAFLEETDIKSDIEAILTKTHHNVMHEVENASEEIQEIILSRELPEALRHDILSSFKNLDAEFVAVRSSATAEDGVEHAWAGQLDTYLNTTEEKLLENVKKCWASLFTPRAIFYRFEKGLAATHISVAVVVQKMVASEYSGIAFSVHPVTEDRNQMIIEAGFGLGEAIVSGQVTPDSYVVMKSPREIIDMNVSEQSRALYCADGGGSVWLELGTKGETQVLTKEQILELADIIIRIENHYGFPCDIEWAYEGGEFYITQSRPITTLSNAKEEESTPVTILEKSFTRERPLFYYYAFPDADKAGIQKYLGKDIDDILFIIQPKGMPGEVWYPQKAFEELSQFALERLNSDADLRERDARDLDAAWEQISPYFLQGKEIETREEAFVYYQYVVDFWMALNTLFFCLVDNPNLHKGFSDKLKSVRDGTQEYTALMSEKFLTFFERAFPEYAHVSHYITPKEVRDLERHDPGLLSTLEERSRVGCFVYRDVLYLLPEMNEVAKKYNFVLQQERVDNETEVRGQSAFKGKVQGVVQIVRVRADLEKVKEGDILVSPITDANYVPAMQRSAAFVTDEGGVMCHAAIVARELKKPCIIGTKVGTQVLKDGDLVEVDADNGVVRILEKHKGQVTFQKKYSRDTSFFMQGLWAEGLRTLALEKYGWKNPHMPAVAHYAHNGFIDIYEHEKAIAWFFDMIQKEIARGSQFLPHLFKDYEGQVKELEQHHKRGLDTKEDVEGYIHTVRCAMFSMTIFFYVGFDTRSPKDAVDISVHARELVDLFADNDMFVRKEIERKGNIPYDLTSVVLSSEVTALPNRTVLEGRLKGCLLVDGELLHTGTLSEIKVTHPEFLFESLEVSTDVSEIKGQIAEKGKVSGVVRIVRKQGDMQYVQEGDILVASMTTPDFLPAMNKASAFITDEGGITCHAAIVAREMRKPCIIGTRIATQVLHNGDLVEVDADSGLVRVLERRQDEKPLSQILGHHDAWTFVGAWEQPVLSSSLFLGWHKSKIVQDTFPGIELGGEFRIAYKAFNPKEDIEKIATRLINIYKAKKLKGLVQELNEYDRLMNEKYKQFLTIEDKKDPGTIERMLLSHAEYHFYWTFLAASIGSQVLRLAKGVGFVKTDAELFEKVHPHLRKTWIEEEQEQIIAMAKILDTKVSADADTEQIKKIIREDKTLSVLLDSYIEKYEWVGTDKWFGTPNTKEKGEARLIEELANIRSGNYTSTHRSEAEFDSLDPIIQLGVLCAYVRANCAGTIAQIEYAYKDALRDIAQSVGRTYEDVINLTYLELISFVRSPFAFVFDDKKFERQKEYLIFLNRDIIEVLVPSDQFYLEIKEEYKETKPQDLGTLKSFSGIGASAGKVTGKVRVVLSRTQFEDFVAGEILVAPETTPAFVPLMRKAAAIITDIGGITSHAAIVSREMKKPCIIATKIATEVLHNGDLVEVDASEGAVRILERAKNML